MTTPSDTLVIKPEEHSLYKAAVAFMVSNRTEEDAWKDIALFVSQWKGDADSLATEFEKTEAQIKTDFSATAMPSKWRSAKSVARKAFASGMSLLDPADKQPYGKTFIEKAMKPVATPMTAGERALYLLHNLQGHCAKAGFAWDSATQKESFKSLMSTVYTTV